MNESTRASETSEVRNTGQANQKLTVVALCGNFYRVKLPESYDFNDELNQDTAYARKSDIEVPVTSVSVSNADQVKELKIGDKIKLKTRVFPEIASRSDLTWKSNNSKIATVSSNGMVTAVKAGSTTIVVTEQYSGATVSVMVKVSDILVTDLKFANAEEVNGLNVGGTARLEVLALPDLATKKKFNWKSSNEKVAVVSAEGVVTAKTVGKTNISVTEIYSGKSVSAEVQTRYSLSEANSSPKVKLVLRKSTDFGGNYLRWNKISKAKSYKIFIEKYNTEKKKYILSNKKGKRVKKCEYYDTNVVNGKKYRYYVKAYDAKGKQLGAKSNFAKLKATAPDVSVTGIGVQTLTLNWEPEEPKPLKGIKGYRIYRSSKKKGKFICVKQVKGKKSFTYTDKKLKEDQTYYYKICAYQKKKKNIKNGFFSKVVGERTVSSQKNWSCFEKNKNNWQGILREKGSLTVKKSTETMQSFGIGEGETRIYPYLKYHLTTDTLYIHLYVRFCTYHGTDKQAKKAPDSSGVYAGIGPLQSKSYKQEFIDGVEKVFDSYVTGSDNDFAPGVRFATKLIVHEEGKENAVSGQQYLEVSIGGDCPLCIGTVNAGVNHWFHAHSVSGNSVFGSANRIHIPDNRYLEKDGKKKPMETVGDFRRMCAHELCHILGLNDGYTFTDNGRTVDRMTENEETCGYTNCEWVNLMLDARVCEHPMANDIEMMLYAYGQSVVHTFPFQSYKEHWKGEIHYKISPVIIRKGEDKKSEK